MEAPRHWRLKKQRYRLIGEKCPHCDEMIFPPRDICPRCKKNTFTLPLRNRTEENYYNEKGIMIEETIKSTRINMAEIFAN